MGTPRTAPVLCVVPTDAASSVDVLTIADAKVAARERIDVSGTERPVSKEGCSGTEHAQWSANNLRVFLRSDLVCTGSIKRTMTGVMAMSQTGEWIDVQGFNAGGNSGVRTAHYLEAAVPAGLPAEYASVVSDRALATRVARAAAGLRLANVDIIEAVKRLDAPVLQAWLVERNQPFDVDAKSLIQLADAGVPGAITDVMVAATYPKQFSLDRGDVEPSVDDIVTEGDSLRIAEEYLRRRTSCGLSSFYDPFGYSIGCGYYSYGLYGYGYYSPYNQYSPYSPYGYGYGYGPGYGYYSGRPIVVVRGEETPHGQLVKGQGYTRGTSSSSSGSSGAARSSGSSGASSGSSSSSGSSGSSSSGSSSGSSGRTAKARPPQ